MKIRFLICLGLIVFNFSVLIFADKDLALEFDKLMQNKKLSYKKKYAKGFNRRSIGILKNLYIKNKRVKHSKILKIPKIIHQIWIGSKPIPNLLKRLQKTWQKKHPDWEYKLWINEDLKSLKLHNQELFNKTKNVREKADLLRYEVLYRYGGLYIDADFECLKSFEPLNYKYDFYAGISSNDSKVIVNNALIASSPGHLILKTIIEKINKNSKLRPIDRSGAFYFSKKLLEIIEKSKGINIVFPMIYFYPIPLGYYKSKSSMNYFKKRSMAVHYWANDASIWNK